MPTLRLTALVIAATLVLSGCARPPEGPPIVLRKKPPAPRVVKPTTPAKPPPVPAQDEPVPLSPSEKEELFRAFDSYLNGTVPQQ